MDRIEKIIGVLIILGGLIAMLLGFLVGAAFGGIYIFIFGLIMGGAGAYYFIGPSENHNTAKMRAETIKRLKKYVK